METSENTMDFDLFIGEHASCTDELSPLHVVPGVPMGVPHVVGTIEKYDTFAEVTLTCTYCGEVIQVTADWEAWREQQDFRRQCDELIAQRDQNPKGGA